MDKQQIALARRAVACRGWRLMRGMRLVLFDGSTTLIAEETNQNGWVSATRGFFAPEPWAALDALPYLTDAATLGCLLALVREAWGDPFAFIGWFDPHWKVIVSSDSLIGCLGGRGASEAEALVAALEAAPNTGGEHRREEE